MKEVKETNSSNAEEVAGFARLIVQICMKLGIIASLISIIVMEFVLFRMVCFGKYLEDCCLKKTIARPTLPGSKNLVSCQ